MVNVRRDGANFKYRADGEEQTEAADGSWRRAQGSRCRGRDAGRQDLIG